MFPLRYCKGIANLLFWVLCMCLATDTQIDNLKKSNKIFITEYLTVLEIYHKVTPILQKWKVKQAQIKGKHIFLPGTGEN